MRGRPRFLRPRRPPRTGGRRLGAGSVIGIIFLALAFSLIIAFIAAYNARTSAHVLSMERRLQEEALRSRELLRVYLINNTETGLLDVVILNAWDRGSEIVYQLTVGEGGAVIDEGRVGWTLPPRMTMNLTLAQPDADDFKVVTGLGNVFASSLPGLFMESGPRGQTQTTSVATTVTTVTTVVPTGTETTTATTTSAPATTPSPPGPPTPPRIFVYVSPRQSGEVRMRGSDGTDRSTTGDLYHVGEEGVTYRFTQTPLGGYEFVRWVVYHDSRNPNPPESGNYYDESISFTARYPYELFRVTAEYVRAGTSWPSVTISAGLAPREGGSFELHYTQADGTPGWVDVRQDRTYVDARPGTTATLDITAEDPYYVDRIVLNGDDQPIDRDVRVFSFVTSSVDGAIDQVTVHFARKATVTYASTLTTVSTVTSTAYGSESDSVSFRSVGFHSGTRTYRAAEGWEATPVSISVYAQGGWMQASVAGVSVETSGASRSRSVSAGWGTAWSWSFGGLVDIGSGSVISASVRFSLRRITTHTTTLTTTVTGTTVASMHIGASGVMMSILLPPIALNALRRRRRSKR